MPDLRRWQRRVCTGRVIYGQKGAESGELLTPFFLSKSSPAFLERLGEIGLGKGIKALQQGLRKRCPINRTFLLRTFFT